MFTLIDKPIEEMTIEELEREKNAQTWLVKSMEYLLKMLNWKIDNFDLKDYKEELEELKYSYINSEISEEEYSKKKRVYTMWRGKNQKRLSKLQDKADFAELIALHSRALSEEIDSRYNEMKYASRPRHKKKKLPATYGYDPRKRISKYNYPRDDWGNTRDNIVEHRKRKEK